MRERLYKCISEVKFDSRGLVPLIVQDAASGAVLSQFYANREALEKIAETGFVWRYSRAHGKLMKKGDTSGNVQKVLSITFDCDKDAVLVRVVPSGPACHTGAFSCFSDEILLEDICR